MLVQTDNGVKRHTPKWSFTFFIHNTIIHPIAGCFWFLGLGRLGNKVHETCKPE